jgi:hypothetical protein
MHQRVEPRRGFPIGEDPCRHARPVERAVGMIDVGSVLRFQRLPDLGIAIGDLVTQTIGIDQSGAVLDQSAGHGGLAAARSAHQSDPHQAIAGLGATELRLSGHRTRSFLVPP